MSLTTSHLDGTAVITVSGDLDIRSAPQLNKTVEKLLKPGLARMIIDFSDITYIDSSGMGTLVSCFKHAQSNQTTFGLASVSGRVCDLLKLTRLQGFFPLYSNLEEAMEQMEHP